MSINPVPKTDTDEKYIGSPLIRTKRFTDSAEFFESTLESFKEEKKEKEDD